MWQNNLTVLSNAWNLMKEMGKGAYLTTLWVEDIKLEVKDRALYSSWLFPSSIHVNKSEITMLCILILHKPANNGWCNSGFHYWNVNLQINQRRKLEWIILYSNRYMDEQNVVKSKEILPFLTIRWIYGG